MDESSAGYTLVRLLARFLLNLFYDRIEVVGAENIPSKGPLIVAANHHNSVVDAMLLVAEIPRRLHILANAPLFGHFLIGPFLRLMGALPVHRRQESGDDPARNSALFAATTATLQAGEAILIFPEGRTQPEPVLLALRTGTARMLLAAEPAGEGPGHVTLLPVGLIFHEPGTFRTGRALVLVGKPVPTADSQALAGESPERAARTLTDRLAEALRGQIVEAEDRKTLGLLSLLEELWREETGAGAPDEVMRVAWLQRALHAYPWLRQHEPTRMADFQRRLETFTRDLDRAGLAAAELSRVYSPGVVVRFALRESFALAIGAPLALLGIVIHALPYRLTAAIVRRLHRTDEEEATDKIAAGIVLYPLAWAAEAVGVFEWWGGRALVLFLAGLLPTGFLALAWRERLEHVTREAGAFFRYLRDPGLPQRLREGRSALARELTALAHLVPKAPSSLSGSAAGEDAGSA